MKSIYLKRNGSADRAFEIKDLPDPIPGEGEVLIDVEYSGLNYADVMARLGLYPDAPPLPAVLGYDVAGRIVQLGSGVKGSRVGSRVIAFTGLGDTPIESWCRLPSLRRFRKNGILPPPPPWQLKAARPGIAPRKWCVSTKGITS